jgi:Uma2 family endonuclease
MRLLADDVLELDVPEHLRGYELVNGELVEVEVPSAAHGRLQSRLSHLLLSYIEAQGIDGEVYSETGFVLGLQHDPERLRLPDVTFVSGETLRAHGGEPRGYFRGIADLVIEIDSPGRRPSIERQRLRDYFEARARLIWVIHAESGTATAYEPGRAARELGAGDVLGGEPVLAGFRLPLDRLFARSSSTP